MIYKYLILVMVIFLSGCLDTDAAQSPQFTADEVAMLKKLANDHVIEEGLTVKGPIDVYGNIVGHNLLSVPNVNVSDSIEIGNRVHASGVISTGDKMESPLFQVVP